MVAHRMVLHYKITAKLRDRRYTNLEWEALEQLGDYFDLAFGDREAVEPLEGGLAWFGDRAQYVGVRYVEDVVFVRPVAVVGIVAVQRAQTAIYVAEMVHETHNVPAVDKCRSDLCYPPISAPHACNKLSLLPHLHVGVSSEGELFGL